jgi:uncharacterized membrane protein
MGLDIAVVISTFILAAICIALGIKECLTDKRTGAIVTSFVTGAAFIACAIFHWVYFL